MIDNQDNSPVDYIFGELDQPQNAARWQKDRLTGVHHYAKKTPDAPIPCKPVTLKVTTDSTQSFESVFVLFSIDNWQTTRKVEFSKHLLTWNSITWSYLQEWQVTLPPQPEGVMLRYKIGAKLLGDGKTIYADNQSQFFDSATHYSIWYGKHNNPRWAKQAMVYQIFVDRFNPGEGKDWNQTTELRKHFGGTIYGVIEKLPYIRDMGFNSIWLTPIFDSPSHHGYDTIDYFKINPRFGTIEDFKELISEAHRLGIKIILDFVANHCSNQHPFFLDALENKRSEYIDWFLWSEWPEYESFFNVGSMPKLNLSYGNPAREHLLDAAKHWLEMGVDGYRLDYANGPEHDFWVDFRRVCSSINPDVWTFGELVLPADVQAGYADGLGGTLDFLLCQAIRATFSNQTWSLTKFAGFVSNHIQYFSESHSLPAFIDNHDMDRFYTVAEENLQRLKLALLVLYVLPGPPIIYYGTEVPLSQRNLLHSNGGLGFDEARLQMTWQEETQFVLAEYLLSLAEMRNQLVSASNFGWGVHLSSDDDQLLVLQMLDGKSLLIVNRSENKHTFSLSIDQQNCKFNDMLNNKVIAATNGKIKVTVPAISGVVLTQTE